MDNKSAEAIDHEYRAALVVAASYKAGEVGSIDRLLTKRAQMARILLSDMDNNGEIEAYYNMLSDEISRAFGIVQRN